MFGKPASTCAKSIAGRARGAFRSRTTQYREHYAIMAAWRRSAAIVYVEALYERD
jgi:hypothetical protein